jgi:hypothetical protein
MIHKASEIAPVTRYRIVLYGVPGARKSTTALSVSSNPLFIDTDYGWDRIEAKFRKGSYIQPKDYDELLADLTPENTKPFDAIIIDTGGALFELMKPYLIRQDPKNGVKSGERLSIQGYGAAGYEFGRLINHCYFNLGKTVVINFHAKEDKAEDNIIYRLDVEGQTKNAVFKYADLAGFIEVRGKKFVVNFSPDSRFYAKGTRGVQGEHEIPTVNSARENTIIADILAKFAENAKTDKVLLDRYEATMSAAREIVDKVETDKDANEAIAKVRDLDHVFASKVEAWEMLKERATAKGLEFSGGVFKAKGV